MRKNLSQQKLLEILTAEIEILQQTSKNINDIAPEIEKQLHKLKTTKLKFELNTERLEWLLANHERQLKKNILIPRWLLVLIVIFLIVSVFTCFICLKIVSSFFLEICW